MGKGFLMLLLWIFHYFLTVSANVEGDALSALRESLSDPNDIFGIWNASLVNPCTFYITCDDNNSVTRIDIQNANLSGQLVAQLGSLQNLQYLELYNNNISGKIPPELGNLANLVSLDLFQNKLNGPIPDEVGKLRKLQFLRLNNNSLSGTIPVSLTSLNALQVLDLSFNNLSGIIPNNGSFSLFNRKSFEGNPYLKPAPPLSSRGRTTHLRAISTVAGVVGGGATLFFVAMAIAFVRRRKRNYRVQFTDLRAKEDCEAHLGQLKRFSLKELRAATNSFHRKNFVGRGAFGEVYKGRMTDGSLVAVKRLKDECTRGEELQFQTELQMISMAVHRNLLRLRGFCMTTTERLLVYPFMANGSVASCLKASEGSQPPILDWPKRKRIALGAARGLAYLHHQCAPKIIHRGVKAASVLLDEEFEAVVGDFSLAKTMSYTDTHVTTTVGGATGLHIAPEYYLTGKCSENTDVFGYGVLLLELVTGQQALDLSRLASENDVTVHDWVKGYLKDRKLGRLVDANLQGNYIEVEAEQLIEVALLCILSIPMQRPTMLLVVKMLEGDGLAERWREWQKQEVLYQESNYALSSNGGWIVDSTSERPPDELSGPR